VDEKSGPEISIQTLGSIRVSSIASIVRSMRQITGS